MLGKGPAKARKPLTWGVWLLTSPTGWWLPSTSLHWTDFDDLVLPSSTCHHLRMQSSLTTTRCLFRTSARLCAAPATSVKRDATRWFSSALIRWSEPDYTAARKWQAQLGTRPITDEIGEISYARSSGPGGQNVNKYIGPPSTARI